MEPYRIETYQPALAGAWNQFLVHAKNATFLFNRGFMDYHSDLFKDRSLLVYRGEKLLAVLPANIKDNQLHSHQGLSYGGLVVASGLKFDVVLALFYSVLKYLDAQGIPTLILKILPEIYATAPAQEMHYGMHLVEAKLIKAELASTIDNRSGLKIQSNRLEGVKKAQKLGLTIKKETSFSSFWQDILIPNLQTKHEAAPVHSVSEIQLLADRFPEHIHQYNVYYGNKLVGGTTLFETQTTVHCQYISANKDKQQLGTLDFLFQHLIQKEFAHKAYFDFGISTVNGGKQLNKGLLYWKECFGARSTVNSTYSVTTANYTALKSFLE